MKDQGNCYSYIVPDHPYSHYQDQPGAVLSVYGEQRKVTHELRLRLDGEGWVTTPAHHPRFSQEARAVKRRCLAYYEEVASCNS